MASTSLRNDGVTIPCPVCARPFTPVGRRRVCSAGCRQALWRRRHPVALPSLPTRLPKVQMVYECPTCATHYLGEQRCVDCGRFCRRVGPGGACPHCDEPVAFADLLPMANASS